MNWWNWCVWGWVSLLVLLFVYRVLRGKNGNRAPHLLEWGNNPLNFTDYILVISYQGGVYKVRGGSTVWHDYPSGIRISSNSELTCSQFYTQIKWELHQDRKKDWKDLALSPPDAKSSKQGGSEEV